MGKQSKEFGIGKKGKLSIELEKPSYVAGEAARGTIYANIHEPIQCDALVLKATGKEKVKWTERDSDECNDEKREHELFKHKIVISSFPAEYYPGTYSYPFELRCPRHYAVRHMERYSSMFIENLEATIKYKFKATLDIGGFLAKDVKTNTTVVVHEQLTPTILASHDSTTQNVTFLCCLNERTCDLAVPMNTNVCIPEAVSMNTNVDTPEETDENGYFAGDF